MGKSNYPKPEPTTSADFAAGYVPAAGDVVTFIGVAAGRRRCSVKVRYPNSESADPSKFRLGRPVVSREAMMEMECPFPPWIRMAGLGDPRPITVLPPAPASPPVTPMQPPIVDPGASSQA